MLHVSIKSGACGACSCSWSDEACDPDSIQKVYTDMGLCYTVNWSPTSPLFAKDTGQLADTVARGGRPSAAMYM